jgi:hypothetical protein
MPRTQEPDELEGDGLLGKEVDEELRGAKRRKSSRCSLSGLWWLSNVLMAVGLLYLGSERLRRRDTVEVAGDVNGIWPRRELHQTFH